MVGCRYKSVCVWCVGGGGGGGACYPRVVLFPDQYDAIFIAQSIPATYRSGNEV